MKLRRTSDDVDADDAEATSIISPPPAPDNGVTSSASRQRGHIGDIIDDKSVASADDDDESADSNFPTIVFDVVGDIARG